VDYVDMSVGCVHECQHVHGTLHREVHTVHCVVLSKPTTKQKSQKLSTSRTADFLEAIVLLRIGDDENGTDSVDIRLKASLIAMSLSMCTLLPAWRPLTLLAALS
jgi:hypothetical protein